MESVVEYGRVSRSCRPDPHAPEVHASRRAARLSKRWPLSNNHFRVFRSPSRHARWAVSHRNDIRGGSEVGGPGMAAEYVTSDWEHSSMNEYAQFEIDEILFLADVKG
jgi:hypothetical protein